MRATDGGCARLVTRTPPPDAAMTATSPTTPHRSAIRAVGWRFVALYALAYMSTCLLFLAPLLVSLALKVNSLV